MVGLLTLMTLLSPSVRCRDEFTPDGWFYRSSSGLTAVPGDIPKGAVGIYLDNNQITTLNGGSFLINSVCTFMSLHANLISEIQAGTFEGLISLKELWLNNNLLTTITPYMFFGLDALESLVLTDNRINNTEDNAFHGLSNLKKIYFYGNSFTQLRRKMFAGNQCKHIVSWKFQWTRRSPSDTCN